MPANIPVHSVRFVIATAASMVEVDFIEELESHTDKGQCTTLFAGIKNISSYFERVLRADPKCAFPAFVIPFLPYLQQRSNTCNQNQ